MSDQKTSSSSLLAPVGANGPSPLLLPNLFISIQPDIILVPLIYLADRWVSLSFYPTYKFDKFDKFRLLFIVEQFLVVGWVEATKPNID